MAARSGDPYDQIMQEIQRLRDDVQSLRSSPFRIPVVDADPVVDLGTNAWLMNDGRLRVRTASGTIKEYAPVGTPGGTTTTVAKPTPPPAKKTYTKTWTAQWTQSYQEDNDQRTGTDYLYYGYADTFNGRQKSLIGFDYNNIKTNLTGASVSKVELFFHQLHSWWNWGGHVRFGMHNNTVKPTSYGGVVKNNMTDATFGPSQAKWVTVATEFGIRFRDGTGRGVLIDNLTDDHAYYGYGAGVSGNGYPPQIRITYVK
jgi:hypothetical protein